jgi:hypothetical protein
MEMDGGEQLWEALIFIGSGATEKEEEEEEEDVFINVNHVRIVRVCNVNMRVQHVYMYRSV